jgi:hypothetical protein
MVKKMIVVLSAVALIITAVGVASAQMYGALVSRGYDYDSHEGDVQVLEEHFRYTRWGQHSLESVQLRAVYRGFSSLGNLEGHKMHDEGSGSSSQVRWSAYGGPVQWGAPPSIPPNSKLVSNIEKFKIVSPGCNPCVKPGLKYEMVKKQVVR